MSSHRDSLSERGEEVPEISSTDTWPAVCILILNWNGRELLAQNLPALTGLDYPGEYRIALVDNGSTDDSLVFVETHFPAIDSIANGQNLGFSRGMNRGLEQTDADVTVLLNTDVEVRKEWLTELVRPMLADPSVGITGSKLYFPGTERLQHAGAMVEYPLAIGRHRYYRQVDHGQAEEQCEVDYVTGASMAIRRQVFEAVGLFDEIFSPFYYEEVDLCRRARDAGFKVLYVPASIAIHHESFASGQTRDRQFTDLNRSRILYVLKHYTQEQFLQDFIPAEEGNLASMEAVSQLRWMRRVYLEIMLRLPDLPVGQESAHAYRQALARLADLAISLPIAKGKEAKMSDTWLLEKAEIRERPFTSRTPVIGPLLAWFRRQWNNVSTKWYVRPLLQQQNEFNMLVTERLHDHDSRLVEQDRDVSVLVHESAEITPRVIEIHRLLQAVEERLTRLEAMQNPGPAD